MNKLIVLFIIFSLASLSLSGQNKQKVVILKLDDVTAENNGAIPVPVRWERVANYIDSMKLNAAFGIIGYSLEQQNKAYFDWIKRRAAAGNVEFWNHGYKNKLVDGEAGDFDAKYEDQLWALKRTDSLAEANLGIKLRVFGPHWSSINEDTDRALAQVKNIKIVFPITLGKAKYFKGIATPRNMDMEYPVHNPNFERFTEEMSKKPNVDFIVLQGHPNSWDAERWEDFKHIVEHLNNDGWVFMTPSQYYAKELKKLK